MSLLETARAIKPKRALVKRLSATNEEVELFIAVMRSEISSKDAERATREEGNSTSYYALLSRVLRRLTEEGVWEDTEKKLGL